MILLCRLSLSLVVASFLAACGGSIEDKNKTRPEDDPSVQWKVDACGNRHYSVKSSLTVDDLVNNAVKNARLGRIKIDAKEFLYVHLGYEALAELYAKLHALQSEGVLLTTLAFDIRDYMIRLSITEPTAADFFRANVRVGGGVLQSFDPSSFEFHTLIQSTACPLSKLRTAAIQLANDAKAMPAPRKTLRVFHGALEAHNIRVGGVASFVSGLVQAENQHTNEEGERDIQGSLVTPFYDLLKAKFFDTAELVGFVDHEVDHQSVRSTIYKVVDQGIEQYLVQADQGYRAGLYNLGEPANLYRYFSDEVWLYYSTALASFTALYRGPNHDENVDVLQINDWHLGMTSAILAKELNPKRKAVGLPPVATIATTHEVNKFQGREIGSYLFERVGLKKPPVANINVQALFQVFSNASNTVSRSVAAEMMSPDPELSYDLGPLFSDLKRMDRFFGITNGIDVTGFDPTTKLGSLNVEKDLSNLFEKKMEARKALYDAGIIGSPSKPLFLYVGRFSAEKGIDLFADFVRLAVDKYDAQVVIMGAKTDASSDRVIDELQAMAKDPAYKNALRIYTNVKTDQLDNLPTVGAAKGLVIRFASDFTFVPSIQESCGLVPIEAMAMGSGVFTSNVHGLQDLCKPLNGPDLRGCMHDVDSFTCATFKRSADVQVTPADLEPGLENLLSHWRKMPHIDKRMAQIRWVHEARNFAWDRKSGAADQYKDLYVRAMQPDTTHDAEVRAKLIDKFVDNCHL